MEYFIHTELKIKYGALPLLTEAMKTLVPFLSGHGWKLVGAYHAIIGSFTDVTHIWEVEGLDCVAAAMANVQSAPHIVEIVSQISEYVVDENLQLVSKTAYSP